MILITGGTGLLGSQLIDDLTKKGNQILAPKRFESIVPDFLSNNNQVTWVDGNLFDLDFLSDCLSQVDTVIHAAAIVNFSAKNLNKLYRTNVALTKQIVDSSLTKGIKHFVHISSVAALGRDGKSLSLDETAKWAESDGNTHYARSKHLAELEVWRSIEEGLPATIVNPSVILGRCDITRSSGVLFGRILKNSKYYPEGNGNFVDVRDVSIAIQKIMEKKIIGERFILNGISLDNKELYTKVAQRLNKKLPSKEITRKQLKYLKPIENFISFLSFRTPQISRDIIKLVGTSYKYLNKKSIEELELNYTDIDDTIDYAVSYLQQKLNQN